jgi:hypothetical protein
MHLDKFISRIKFAYYKFNTHKSNRKEIIKIPIGVRGGWR